VERQESQSINVDSQKPLRAQKREQGRSKKKKKPNIQIFDHAAVKKKKKKKEEQKSKAATQVSFCLQHRDQAHDLARGEKEAKIDPKPAGNRGGGNQGKKKKDAQ